MLLEDICDKQKPAEATFYLRNYQAIHISFLSQPREIIVGSSKTKTPRHGGCDITAIYRIIRKSSSRYRPKTIKMKLIFSFDNVHYRFHTFFLISSAYSEHEKI